MPIETVDYKYLMERPDLRNGVADFAMDVTYPFRQTIFLTDEEFEAHKARLETPPTGLRTFIIGAMTGMLDVNLRRLPDEYINFIERIHSNYEQMGIDSYSCFRRERYGEIGITSDHATVLDRLALDTSHFLTILPGATNSLGTWKEIVHAVKTGTHLVGLFRERDPEMGFRQRIMEAAAVHGGKSRLFWVTGNETDLIPQLNHAIISANIF